MPGERKEGVKADLDVDQILTSEARRAMAVP